jgi:iron complex outermembrane recepter protein
MLVRYTDNKSAFPMFCLLSVFLPLTTYAQQNSVIEEIVVTAEKRTSTVQETAIAITAYSDEMLELRGIESLEDLQFSAPNLVISENSQSPVSYAYIRGVGSDQLVAGFDPGVAYHVDGVYVGQPSSMPGDMWDLERVEVLRGPQGTLYGRNTTGGSINVITKDPTTEFAAFGDLTVGNYGRQRFRGVVNGGSDAAAFRLSFIQDEDDGYQDNQIGSDGDQTDYSSIRGKAKFALGDRGELVLSAQRFQNDGRMSQRRREPFGPVELAPGFVLNVYDGAIPNSTNPRKVAKNHPEELDLTNEVFSARLTIEFEKFSLVSITGKISNDWFQTSDIDMSSNAVQYQDWTMETDQLTQEIQLVSNGDGPLDWIVGVFYFDEDLETDYKFEDNSIAGFTFFNGGDLETRSKAIFAQLSYDLRDTGSPYRVNAGLRWTEDEKEVVEYQRIPQFGVNLAAPMKRDWSEVSGKIGLDWFVDDKTLAYASYSRGYKGGGFSIGQFDAFDPEIVNAYEIGWKTQLMDQRAQVNMSLFYNDYKDLQVNFLLFTSFTTDNAAEASIQGLELEGTLLATDNLTLGAMFTWLDAEFDEYQFTPADDLSGQTLNRAPEFTVGLSAQYEWSLGDNGNLLARADYYWQDEVYYRVQNIARHRESSFSTVDLRMIWSSANDQWQVDLFAKNIGDGDNLRGLTVSDGLSTGNSSFESYYPPRTIGLRVGFRTGAK